MHYALALAGPAYYKMKDGDPIEFHAEIKQDMLVRVTVHDDEGRSVTSTMCRSDRMQVLLDFYNGAAWLSQGT